MTTLQTVIVERPPPGPARGKWEAPVWAIVLIAASTVIVAAAYFLWRVLRARKIES